MFVACLGKMIAFSTKLRKRYAFSYLNQLDDFIVRDASRWRLLNRYDEIAFVDVSVGLCC